MGVMKKRKGMLKKDCNTGENEKTEIKKSEVKKCDKRSSSSRKKN